MKNALLTGILLSACVLFSCSKKDDTVVTPPKNKTTIEINNGSIYDFKAFRLFAITGTTKNDVTKDTTASTRTIYNLGALASGKTITTEIDPKFKSMVMVFTYNNPVLGNKDFTAYITTLGDGSDAVPYVFKPKQTVAIKLDDKMKFMLLQ